eukprot:PhF_6_TR32347/c0_g1_i3/m.47961
MEQEWISVEVRHCKVKTIDHWSSTYSDTVVLGNNGIDVYHHDPVDANPSHRPLAFHAPWTKFGFGSQGSIVCSRMYGFPSRHNPVRISFEYSLADDSRRVCEIDCTAMSDVVQILYGISQAKRRLTPHGPQLVIEEPTAWPLPSFTFYSQYTVSLYTPRIRTLFRRLSKINHLLMDLLVMVSVLEASTNILSRAAKNPQNYLILRLLLKASRYLPVPVLTVLIFLSKFFKNTTFLWIVLQKMNLYLHMWRYVNRGYRSLQWTARYLP